MAPSRPSHRSSRTSTPERTAKHHAMTSAPCTPRPYVERDGDVVMGATGVLVPPSPGFLSVMSDCENPPASPGLPIRNASSKMRIMGKDRTGAGVKKTQCKSRIPVKKQINVTASAAGAASGKAENRVFRFMDLPGEIRNIVYHHTFTKPKQALLVHCPRMASLRPRTRLDRQRTLDSDIKDRELGFSLSTNADRAASRTKAKTGIPTAIARETNRPFWGLTQVSSQLRAEYRPIYLQKQEIGMDLTETVAYLRTFYAAAPREFKKLHGVGKRIQDMPFNGNITIAVADRPLEVEKSLQGVEVIPLLDLWANSVKIEAGFGRYLKPNYNPASDGEAKDLYRLFGRKVLPTRQCSSMNNIWRTILRTRSLASITLHRAPAPRTVLVSSLGRGALPQPPGVPMPTHISMNTKPFIHILFRRECAEPWMNQLVSEPPKELDWLAERGFDAMEYFDVRVGVAPNSMDKPTI